MADHRTGPEDWESWKWDESLFQGAAKFYEKGRLPYAPSIGSTLAEALALDGVGRLLDVGCGPGTVTAVLASYFADAVGIDPDPGMIAAARRVADIEWDILLGRPGDGFCIPSPILHSSFQFGFEAFVTRSSAREVDGRGEQS